MFGTSSVRSADVRAANGTVSAAAARQRLRKHLTVADRPRQHRRYADSLDRLAAEARLDSPSFRPNQEAVCRAVIEGQDVLLVMPTGSGKSLCYQLPGIARGGTTLVISPLIALMEDQVAQAQRARLRGRPHPLRPRPRRLAPSVRAITSTARCIFFHRAGAAAGARISGDAREAQAVARSPSTRRTAFRNGGTISGPTTACSASTFPPCGRRRSSR